MCCMDWRVSAVVGLWFGSGCGQIRGKGCGSRRQADVNVKVEGWYVVVSSLERCLKLFRLYEPDKAVSGHEQVDTLLRSRKGRLVG